jgi:hypothetical protein
MKIITELKESAGITMPQKEIIFTGPPELLTGEVIFENKSRDDFHLSRLPLVHDKIKELSELHFDAFQVNSDLNAGQRLLQSVRISLDPNTPPAVHDLDVLIGGIRKKIKMIIQPNVSVEITPEEITLLGTDPGTSHRTGIQVSNNGNVPVVLPSGEYRTELAGKSIMRCLETAVRETSGKTATDTLEAFFGNIRNEMESGVKIMFEKSGITLKPGESATISLVITLPANAKPMEKYDGSVNILNDKLSYKIIASVKAEPVSRISKKTITKR